MVARTQGAHLVLLALFRLFRDLGRIGTAHPALLLDAGKVAFLPVTLRHGPASAIDEHPVHLATREMNVAGAAEAGGNVAKKHVGQGLLCRHHLIPGEARVQGADAA